MAVLRNEGKFTVGPIFFQPHTTSLNAFIIKLIFLFDRESDTQETLVSYQFHNIIILLGKNWFYKI